MAQTASAWPSWRNNLDDGTPIVTTPWVESFRDTELRLLEPLCGFHFEKDFVVYKSERFPEYRLANGILILGSAGRTLKDWEGVFESFFESRQYPHKTFTFFNNGGVDFLKKEASAAGYREANSFPILMWGAGDPPLGPGSESPEIHKIGGQDEWEKYRDFHRELYPDNRWACERGFDILKVVSQTINVERFYCREEGTGKIISALGLLKQNDVARVENVQTLDRFRRRGLARHLLSFAKRHAVAALQTKRLVLTSANTEAARNMYQAAGFRQIGEKVELMNYE